MKHIINWIIQSENIWTKIEDLKLTFMMMLTKIKVLGISTTNSNDKIAPRKSTSDAALSYVLEYAKKTISSGNPDDQAQGFIFQTLRGILFKECQSLYISMFNIVDG